MTHHTATFRFYAELNDFLPLEQRQRAFSYTFRGRPAIKDTIEAISVPHAEVDLILVDGTSVGFDHQLQGGERVAVYPVFETFDITSTTETRNHPLRETKFILDVHLGKLAGLLRLLGFDAAYRNDYDDHEIIAFAREDHRIILTRDIGLLKHKVVTHGYWVRSTRPLDQAREVIERFHLAEQARPFRRCLKCNGLLTPVEKESIIDRVPPHVGEAYDDFLICSECKQLYWKGSHFEHLQAKVLKLLEPADSELHVAS
ncbi:MAG: Mut7-C RNAse domain-containing protein [Anaerolineae bacterium]